MKATVDANILFACLIKKEETRSLWFNSEINLYAPAFIIEEFLKYEQLIIKKSKMKEPEFENLLKSPLSQLTIVQDSNLKPFMPAAASLTKDEKDWLYIACALKENAIIWSNDKGFKKQDRIKTLSTEEMIKEFGTL